MADIKGTNPGIHGISLNDWILNYLNSSTTDGQQIQVLLHRDHRRQSSFRPLNVKHTVIIGQSIPLRQLHPTTDHQSN